MPSHTKRGVSIRVISLVAVGFGLLTIKQGGASLHMQGAPSTAGPASHRLLQNPV